MICIGQLRRGLSRRHGLHFTSLGRSLLGGPRLGLLAEGSQPDIGAGSGGESALATTADSEDAVDDPVEIWKLALFYTVPWLIASYTYNCRHTNPSGNAGSTSQLSGGGSTHSSSLLLTSFALGNIGTECRWSSSLSGIGRSKNFLDSWIAI